MSMRKGGWGPKQMAMLRAIKSNLLSCSTLRPSLALLQDEWTTKPLATPSSIVRTAICKLWTTSSFCCLFLETEKRDSLGPTRFLYPYWPLLSHLASEYPGIYIWCLLNTAPIDQYYLEIPRFLFLEHGTRYLAGKQFEPSVDLCKTWPFSGN